MATVRLDTSTEAVLKRLSSARGQTKSEVIRDAIARLAAEEGAEPSAYDRLRPYIGIVELEEHPPSKDTGQRFRSLVEAKHRARRPR